MILKKYLWVKGRKYYLYGIYEEYEQCKKIAKKQLNKNGARYYIINFTTQGTMWIPETRHALYLSKTINMNIINRKW